MSDNRESILRRLNALSQKTTENGCTESEAFAAAEMLASMMDRHGFDQADLGTAAEAVEAIDQHVAFDGDKIGNLNYVAVAVGAYCDVKVWTSGNKTLLNIFGRESDRQLAEYLLRCFRAAMKSEWKVYLKTRPGITGTNGYAAIRASFEIAMMRRIADRLREMKAARNATVDVATGRTGSSLVVVKDAAVSQAYRALSLALRTPRSRTRAWSADAGMAGTGAGNRVNIGTGIAGSKVLRIAG